MKNATTKKDANAEYAALLKDITDCVTAIQHGMRERAKVAGQADWADVGDLQKIRYDLNEAIGFMFNVEHPDASQAVAAAKAKKN